MASKKSKQKDEGEVIEEKVTSTQTEDSNNQIEESEENQEEIQATCEGEEVDKVEELTLKVSELNDKYLRLTAEYDNYRKRTLKERMELIKSAGEGTLKSLLPVVDDFDRAISHLNEASDLEAVKKGIDLIYNKFQEFLKRNGVVEIEAKDKDFDTDLHEAVTKIPAPSDTMKGKVVDCIEKGYMLNDKIIRFAKVVVGE